MDANRMKYCHADMPLRSFRKGTEAISFFARDYLIKRTAGFAPFPCASGSCPAKQNFPVHFAQISDFWLLIQTAPPLNKFRLHFPKTNVSAENAAFI